MAYRTLIAAFGYLVLYVLGAYLRVDPKALSAVFLVGHVVTLGWLGHAWYLEHRRCGAPGKPLAVWAVVFLLFWWAGAYWEYPSDHWEHVRRTFGWEGAEALLGQESFSKFTYFFNWTLVRWLPQSCWRPAIDFVGAFWQTWLLYYAVYAGRAFGFRGGWEYVNAALMVGFFGSNVFSFFRYYALSSTPLAYGAYLFLLAQISAQVRREHAYSWKEAGMAAVCLALIAANHRPELIFLVFAGGAAGLVFATQWAHRKGGRAGVGSLFGGLCAVLVIAIYFGYIPARSEFAWNELKLFRFWGRELPFLDTIALPGLLALGLAAFAVREFPFVTAALFLPYYVLLFPQFTFWFVEKNTYYVTYRLLFTLPLPFGITAGLVVANGRGWLKNRKAVAAGAILLSFMAVSPRQPFRGRFWHQLYSPDPTLTLADTTLLPAAFRRLAIGDPRCLLAGDHVTDFVLAAFWGKTLTSPARGASQTPPIDPPHGVDFERWLKEQGFCGILAKSPQAPPVADSKVARLSYHWYPDAVAGTFLVSDEMMQGIKSLEKRGWRTETIGKTFLLAAPPKDR